MVACCALMTYASVPFLLLLFALANHVDGGTDTRDSLDVDPEGLPPDYDRYKPPLINGSASQVYVFLQVMDLDEVTEESMDFRIHMYLDEIWRDDRVNFTFSGHTGDKSTPLPEYKVQQLWKPDLVFDSCKKGELFSLSVPNTFMRVLPDGSLYRTTRYNLKVTCLMDLNAYPMDTQRCDLSMSSLAYTEDELILSWTGDDDSPYRHLSPSIQFTYEVRPLKYAVKSPYPDKMTEKWVSGNYSILLAKFTFVRCLSSHVVNLYIPTTLVVIMSWLSFWLDVSAVPARVTLGVTSLLTLATQVVQSRSNIPHINYMTALDVWLFICIVTVFSTLLEYAFYYHYVMCMRKKKAIEAAMQQGRPWDGNKRRVSLAGVPGVDRRLSVASITAQATTSDRICYCYRYLKQRTSDEISRVLFPVLFSLFAIVYWQYYFSSWAAAMYGANSDQDTSS